MGNLDVHLFPSVSNHMCTLYQWGTSIRAMLVALLFCVQMQAFTRDFPQRAL